jgi:hypothetical protein
MNQEKARKYLAEIDLWLNDTSKTFELITNPITPTPITSPSSEANSEQFLLELVLELNEKSAMFNEQPNELLFLLSNNNNNNNNTANNSGCQMTNLSLPNDDSTSKQSSLLKNIELITSQVKSLSSMFEKRKEQLRKSAYPSTSKPVQRVEPQLFNNNNNSNSNDSTGQIIHQIDSSKLGGSLSSSSLIKRESMNKVDRIY